MRILRPWFCLHGPKTQDPRRKEQMSRLEDAEKRLHGAISRLESSLSARAEIAADESADEADLREPVSDTHQTQTTSTTVLVPVGPRYISEE